MTIHQFSARSITGEMRSLNEFAGQVCLIVNVASACGFTPQYAALETLYRRHRDAGFAVLGFPCDQFGHQEPGDEATIAAFCLETYGVSFPLFAKVAVNGRAADPLYRYLTAEKPGILGSRRIKWNFTKFLVGRDGAPVARYRHSLSPAQIEPDIVRLLDRGTG